MRKVLFCAIGLLALLALSGQARTAPAETTEHTLPAKEPQVLGGKSEITIRTELAPPPQLACQAQLDMSYYQKGASVVVETELTNADCAASSGTYLVQVRYRGDSPEIMSMEFPETWERPDDQPIKSEKEYFVAENVDIIRVRSRKLRCECTVEEAPADEPPAAE